MGDKYINFANLAIGQFLIKKLGLPNPVKLKRYDVNKVLVDGPVLLGSAENSILIENIVSTLSDIKAEMFTIDDPLLNFLKEKKSSIQKYDLNDTKLKFKSLIFDASNIEKTEDLRKLYTFFHPVARKLINCARIIIFGINPEKLKSIPHATVQRALKGFVKSIGKEFKKGSTAQLIYINPDAQNNIDSTLRFFISDKSSYVSGQTIKINKAEIFTINQFHTLKNTLTLVTGAAQGIGESIAKTMAREGAKVICLDVLQAEDKLKKVAQSIDGYYLTLDITADDAALKIGEFIHSIDQKSLDSIVHNAGITRDKTLANMSPELWDTVINVNLTSIEKINRYLLEKKLISNNGRIVCVSSISGIAGNFGQTNYATSKAGIIGLVKSTALILKDGITMNAVAPGFIETKMTEKIPLTIREAGRRMNSLSQGGLPVDVAETITWLASPASTGINGNIIRVCGQSLLGA